MLRTANELLRQSSAQLDQGIIRLGQHDRILMPVSRKSPKPPDLHAEWLMLGLGLGLSLIGLLIWFNSGRVSLQIVGLILVLLGLGAGLRALAGFVKATRDKN